MWGDSVGESFGAGGLGLSGIGEGGGRGEGIGLGSIGTIGRGGGGAADIGGVGGGTGAGYGTGSGRLAKARDVKKVRVTLDGASSSSRARLERMLTMCNLADSFAGSVEVVEGVVKGVKITPANACTIRQLQRTFFESDVNGTHAFTITPVTP